MRLNSQIARAYLLRGGTLWLGARLLAAAVLAAANASPFPTSADVIISLVVITTLLGFADIHRRHAAGAPPEVPSG